MGAHGYLHPERYENRRQTVRYIDAVVAGESPIAHVEHVDGPTQRTETVMLGLRLLREGLNCDHLLRDTGTDIRTERREAIDRLEAMGLVHIRGNRLVLAEQVALVAHDVIAALM